jgi:hypothetical protein
MEIATVSQAIRKQDGEMIIAMMGKLTDVNNPIAGKSASTGEDYKFQNVKLQCTENPKNKIKVKIWNHDNVAELRGQVIFLLSTRGEGKKSSQWFGVKRTIDTYQGANDPMIDCSAKAEITTLDPRGESAPAAQPQTRTQNQTRGNVQAPRQQAGNQNRTQGNPQGGGSPETKPKTVEEKVAEREEGYRNAVKDSRFKLAKAANLYLLALRAANHIRTEWQVETGAPMPEPQFQAIASTLYLYGERQCLYGGLPPGDLSKYLPTPKGETQTPEGK